MRWGDRALTCGDPRTPPEPEGGAAPCRGGPRSRPSGQDIIRLAIGPVWQRLGHLRYGRFPHRFPTRVAEDDLGGASGCDRDRSRRRARPRARSGGADERVSPMDGRLPGGRCSPWWRSPSLASGHSQRAWRASSATKPVARWTRRAGRYSGRNAHQRRSDPRPRGIRRLPSRQALCSWVAAEPPRCPAKPTCAAPSDRRRTRSAPHQHAGLACGGGVRQVAESAHRSWPP